MAVYTYGVVNTDVYGHLPFGTSNISASSKVTPDDITSYIEDASGEISGALRNAGVGYQGLDDDQTAAIKRAIIQYAVWATCSAIGFDGEVMRQARVAYDACLARYLATPRAAGVAGATVQSNVSTNPARPRKFGRDLQW